MKSILPMTALAALVMATAVTTVQADEVSGLWLSEGPPLLLAEGGSERLIDFFLRREALVSDRSSQDSGERFVQMIKEQPTASGAALEQQEQGMQKPETRFNSPIQRDRALYGSPH